MASALALAVVVAKDSWPQSLQRHPQDEGLVDLPTVLVPNDACSYKRRLSLPLVGASLCDYPYESAALDSRVNHECQDVSLSF